MEVRACSMPSYLPSHIPLYGRTPFHPLIHQWMAFGLFPLFGSCAERGTGLPWLIPVNREWGFWPGPAQTAPKCGFKPVCPRSGRLLFAGHLPASCGGFESPGAVTGTSLVARHLGPSGASRPRKR